MGRIALYGARSMQKDILRASAFWVLAALVFFAPPAGAAECGESSEGFRA
jgi:hypothetical protein